MKPQFTNISIENLDAFASKNPEAITEAILELSSINIADYRDAKINQETIKISQKNKLDELLVFNIDAILNLGNEDLVMLKFFPRD